ncbi:putative Zn-dependent peptidase [Rubidibacter lacunae KORDI 51-2]|uniref:Putative Zn-dependent peptidase n=1 Tax=Rubidibacter lacunae KORDI 51-2 TaxID=582515 RepID=U5DSE5_9CHRO|nr:pitrilysin family protein [Rubidibacter lacunae]ERN42585.1 putative Zn-dependent peptidase [Rubidibacter lacunae KORDI 51-2]
MTQLAPPLRHVRRTTLANGIEIVVVENPSADIIAGRLMFVDAGTRAETPDKAGLAHLLASVLTKGTEHRSAAEIAEAVESVGAGLGTDATSDYFGISLKTVSGDFVEIFDLVGELARAPSFPDAEVALERSLALQSLRARREQPFEVALEQLRGRMYGNHPYGRSSLGMEDTLGQLQREDLHRHHGKYLRPDRLVVSLSGRISIEEAADRVAAAFGDWSAPDEAVAAIAHPTPVPYPQRVLTEQDTQQAIVMLGYLTAPVRSEDYAPLKLLNSYLGNGLSSRLFVELREKLGLAYDVSAFYPTRVDDSHFITYIGTAPSNTAVALAGLHREVERLCALPLSTEELQVAKNKLLGQYALGKQSNSQLAQLFGWYVTLGLGVEFDTEFQAAIAAVTPEQACEVAQRYFEIEPYLSLVGPHEAIALASN